MPDARDANVNNCHFKISSANIVICQRNMKTQSTHACHTGTHNHFTALCTLSWYQKVHFAIFWIFWCKMKITQAETPTIRMDCHPMSPSRLIGAPISAISMIFTLDAIPGTTLPIYPGLGQAPKMLACIPSGLVIKTQSTINKNINHIRELQQSKP